MTDSTGVFQHAIFGVPNFAEGYCTDDNARAFVLAVLLGELGDDPEGVRTLAFLLSLAEMRLAQNIVTSFREPIAAAS